MILKPLKDIRDSSSNLILPLSLLSIGHLKVQQSKTPPGQEEGHFKYTQQRCHHLDTCTHLCLFGSVFVSCVSLPHCAFKCLFSCHLVSLDESILGLEGGSVPGHFQSGGRHS